MDLDDWRGKIDDLNAKLVELLSERARCAIEIGLIKRDKGLPLYAPEREAVVLTQLKVLNKGPLSDEAIERVFRQIIDEALRLEQERTDES